MMFVPTYPAKQHQYSWWTENILTNLVCRYHSQGGTDYTAIRNERMQEDLDYLLEQMGEETNTLHSKAFKLLSKKLYQKTNG